MRLNSRCAHPPERMGLVSTENRWPAGTLITWAVDDDSPLPTGLTADQVVAALSIAMGKWAAASGLTAQHLPTGAPRVLVQFYPLDPSGIELGLTELPTASVTQVRLQLNSLVSWTAQELSEVATHEFGHALGLGHCLSGLLAIMDPVYNPGLADLQTWDFDQVVQRYPAKTAPPPPPGTVVIHVDAAGSRTIELDFVSPGDYQVVVTPV